MSTAPRPYKPSPAIRSDAGDREGERAFRLAAIGRQMVERRRDETGDPAFHVDRAAAIQAIAGNLARKRRVRPRALVSRWNNVGMPSEQEIGPRRTDARIEIVHRRGSWLGKNRPMCLEPGARQEILQIRERAGFVGRHGAAADEVASDGYGVGWHSKF